MYIILPHEGIATVAVFLSSGGLRSKTAHRGEGGVVGQPRRAGEEIGRRPLDDEQGDRMAMRLGVRPSKMLASAARRAPPWLWP